MRRVEDWNKRFRDGFRRRTFPPRVVRDLERYAPPEEVATLAAEMQQDEGRGVYIHGAVGSGKTVLAAMVLEVLRLEEYIHPAVPSEYMVEGEKCEKGTWAFFLSVCNLLGELRDTFSPQGHSTEREVIERYSGVRYLVLDDIGAEKVTDWTLQSLSIIVNNRYEYLKPTIFTSNYSLDQLAERLGDDRIPSRIFAMCYVHSMEGKDRRLGK